MALVPALVRALPRRGSSNVMHRIAVPRDLDAVTQIDRATECDPLEVGLSSRQLNAVWDAVRGLYRTGYYPAIMFSLRRNGRTVFSRAIGHASGNAPGEAESVAKRLASATTPSCIFSASKALTAMLLHRLEEMAELDLQNPVAYYVPEFGHNGKDQITIHQLLTHRGGIPSIDGVDDPRVILDHQRALRLLCREQPQFPPNSRPAYHAVTSGVIIEEIVRRVAGMDVRSAWRKWFKQPMGLEVLDYGASARLRSQISEQSLTGMQDIQFVDDLVYRLIGTRLGDLDKLIGDAAFYRAVIPSANMVATAEEMTAFFQMLLDGGRYDGRQILHPETIKRATTPFGSFARDAKIGIPMRYSPGFMMGASPFGLFGLKSAHAFGHVGLSNNLVWADPQRQISVALLFNGIPLVANNMAALVRVLWRITTAFPRIA